MADADFLKIIEQSIIAQSEAFGDNFIIDREMMSNLTTNYKNTEAKNIKSEPQINAIEQEIVKPIIEKKATQSDFTPDFQIKKTPEKIMTIPENWYDTDSLMQLKENICNCKECILGNTRNKFVFGSGNPNADIMIIGEAPGADEDEQGLPFVGRAGQLLTKILESVNLTREEVFIANIIKCRPPNNRRPESDEVDKCEQYLIRQIEIIKPEFILSLGLTSVDTLLKKSHKMGDIRGKLMNYQNIKMLVTYHPAALLRNPNWKKFVWEDVKYLKSLYDEFLSER